MRVLLINELLQSILEEVLLENSVDGQQTLAGLARTARVFHESALAILWRNMSSLEPFVALQPSKRTRPKMLRPAPYPVSACYTPYAAFAH